MDAMSSAGTGRGGRRLASLDDTHGPYSLIVLSPHFDDAALCLGGTIAHRSVAGDRALVVDVFSARPPTSGLSPFARFQHQQWGGGEPWLVREAEEMAAMSILGADHLWLDLPDAIYRGDLYASEEALFGDVSPGDPAADPLAEVLSLVFERHPEANVYAPLAVGGHVDHRLVRRAALAVASCVLVHLYEDVPYCLASGATTLATSALAADLAPGTELATHTWAFGEEQLQVKVEAVEAYKSQARWIFRGYGEPAECLRSLALARSPAPDTLGESTWWLAPKGAR
jgi:LmbE family N-acetylglucosaminyl deacetylase